MRFIAVFAALLAVAVASPSLEVRQQGVGCKEFHNTRCEDHGLVKCDGAGSIIVCCKRCY